MEKIVKNLELTSENIDLLRAEHDNLLENRKIDSKTVIQTGLLLEECLLRWKEKYEGQEISVIYSMNSRKLTLTLKCAGEAINPLLSSDANDLVIVKSIIGTLENGPQYSYLHKINTVQIPILNKKLGQLPKLLLLIALGVITGLLLTSISPSFSEQVLNSFVNPLYDTAFTILGCISGPLIFLSVMWGIYGIGDASTLGLVGKRLILAFFGVLYGASIIGIVVFPILGNTLHASAGSESQLSKLFEMFLSIFPGDIFSPFVNGNTLQVILLAIVCGFALLFLGSRVKETAQLIEQINVMVQFIMRTISRIIPYFIYLVVVQLILSGTINAVFPIWKFALLFLAAMIVISVVMTLVVSLRFKVSPILLLKKSLNTFIITITTASSAAAFGTNVETCQKKFGIASSLTSFGIPLGMVIFDIGNTLYYLFIAFYFAAQYSVKTSASWIVMAVLICPILAISTPPIPGGSAISYSLLFLQLGIPSEAVAIALSLDIIFDFVRTAANMYNLPLLLINVADSLQLLDRDVLLSKK